MTNEEWYDNAFVKQGNLFHSPHLWSAMQWCMRTFQQIKSLRVSLDVSSGAVCGEA